MKTGIKPTKLTFKKTESEWYNYHNTLREIAKLREEIMTPFEEQEDEKIVAGANSVRNIGDPTYNIATRLTTSKQLRYLEEITNAIEQVYESLPDNYKKLVQLRYWNNKDLVWDVIAEKLHVSKRQAFRWRDEIIHSTIEILGWR